MLAAPHPADENGRLADLRAHGVLDTEPEADFDAATSLAAAACATPIALVSLIDEDRQWFKARVGLEARETPRDLAFCAHAILQPELFEIPDARDDPRFVDNPLVVGAPNIRFYAGMPLVSAGGHALGTLCVIDQVPRTLNEAQRDHLRLLAGQVAEQLEARRRLRELARPGDPSTVHDPTARTVHGGAEHVDQAQARAPGAGEPRRCGRFTILRRIGEGGMATVYAALDAELDRHIAIKLLHGDGDADMRVRVQREAQALARVSHPNVVQIFEIGSYGAQVFVAMELIDGLTLSAWRRELPRSLAEIVAMYVQAGRGLVAAHSVGIIHRDFKADNVIVGRDQRARVVDFGLARILGAAAAHEGHRKAADDSMVLTQAGTIVGTPAYMSPEQHRSAAVDERSDQFNFCAALYEGIYGHRPFSGATLKELSAKVTAGVIELPRPDDKAPEGLYRALLQGLAPDPSQRWSSLATLLDRLESLELLNNPVRARQRRVLIGLLIALVVTIPALLLYRLAYVPVTDGPTGLVLLADGALALALAAAWYVRNTLLVDAVHRRMIGVALFILAADCVGRVHGMLAGLSVANILHTEMLMIGVGFAALAGFALPSMWPLAGLFLAGAFVLVVVDLPVSVVAASVFIAAALLFAHEWRRAATRSAHRPAHAEARLTPSSGRASTLSP